MKQTYLSSHERKERIVRFVLAGLASVLLITGFATPQIVQLAEFQSRGEFVSRLAKEQETLATYRQQNDLKTLKAGLMLSEVEAYVTELSKLKNDIEALEGDMRSLTDLSLMIISLDEPLQKYSELLEIPGVDNALGRIKSLVEPNSDLELRTVYLNTVSWFIADESELGELFDVIPATSEPLPHDLDKMTNAQFSEVKLRLNEIKHLQSEELDRQATLNVMIGELEASVKFPDNVLKNISDEFAEWLNTLEERAVAVDYDLDGASEANENVQDLIRTKWFTVERGEIQRSQPNKSDDSMTNIEIGDTVKGTMISSLLRALIAQITSAESDLVELEEEQLRLEELERLLEEQRILEHLQLQQQNPIPPEEQEEVTEPPVTTPEEPTEEPVPEEPPAEEIPIDDSET